MLAWGLVPVTPLERGSEGRFPTGLCVFTLALTLVTFGCVVWTSYAAYRDAAVHRSRDLRIEESGESSGTSMRC